MKNSDQPKTPILTTFLSSLPPGLLSGLTLAAILWLALAQDPLHGTGVRLFPGADKVAHACMFGGLFFMICLDRRLCCAKRQAAHRERMCRLAKGRIICLTALACVALGGAVELAQGAMDMGRGADWLDFLADAAGVGVAAVLTPCVLRFLKLA